MATHLDIAVCVVFISMHPPNHLLDPGWKTRGRQEVDSCTQISVRCAYPGHFNQIVLRPIDCQHR
eukprot:4792806-Lingulodinium_polyedra.AAC.1